MESLNTMLDILSIVLEAGTSIASVVGLGAVVAASPVAAAIRYIPIARKCLKYIAFNFGEAENKKD